MPNEKKVKAPKAPKAPKAKKAKSSAAFERQEEEPTVRGALSRIGLFKRSGALVITASKEVNLPPEQVWEAWSEIEKWPTWDKPLITTARWVEGRAWVNGAKFELTYNWGPGLGKPKTTETARDVMEPQSVSWFHSKKGLDLFGKSVLGLKYCHIWFFEPTASGGTNIIRTTAMTGFPAFIARLFGGRRKWTNHYKASLDALARFAERAPAKAATDVAQG